jgi:hypothetical protein
MSNRIFLAVGTLFVLSTVALSQMQGASDAANTIRDVDFNSPFDDT